MAGYPTKWKDLYRYRVVVLNNVPAQAVTVVGVLMLKEYLQDGGCVVMMGDTHSLTAGGWDTSVLSSLLPVKLMPTTFVHAASAAVIDPADGNALQAWPGLVSAALHVVLPSRSGKARGKSAGRGWKRAPGGGRAGG